MAIEDIDLGTIPLDGTDGDTAREAFTKVNGNFDDLDTRVTALENEPEPGTVSSVNGILPNSSGNVSLTAANVGAATAAQGLLADSAVQPSSLGTAAYLDANDFATNEQGSLAETAVQPATLEDYERLLIAGDGITIDRSNPDNPVISSSGGTGTGTVTSVAGISPSPDGNVPQTDLVTALGINNKVDKVEGKQLSTEDYTNQEKLKLAAISPQATQNQTDAYLLSRANHTGTQTASTISDFASTVRSNLLTGLSAGTNAVIAATDTLLQALAKLQAQINSKQDSLVSGTNIKTINGQTVLGSGDLPLSATDPDISYTIIYPNGGTVATPATLAVSSVYSEPNPFPGKPVICIAEIFAGGVWGISQFDGESTTNSIGVTAGLHGNDFIRIKTGSSFKSGNNWQFNTFNDSSIYTTAPVRVKVWRVKG